jgi:hypothetical protein
MGQVPTHAKRATEHDAANQSRRDLDLGVCFRCLTVRFCRQYRQSDSCLLIALYSETQPIVNQYRIDDHLVVLIMQTAVRKWQLRHADNK